MDMNCYIAMTAAEFYGAKTLPTKVGWMACHFSQWGSGLSNLPEILPPRSLLILDDSHPPAGHDPQLIAQQLAEAVQRLQAEAVLLDLQKPGNTETAHIATHLTTALPCPVCVAAPYAADLPCPVLLPSPPLHKSLKGWLTPWKGRQIWLEATLEAERITVTEQGSNVTPLPFSEPEANCFTEARLHCRYWIREYEDRVEFTLTRDRDMLGKLLASAAEMGVAQAVGLYQQLG